MSNGDTIFFSMIAGLVVLFLPHIIQMVGVVIIITSIMLSVQYMGVVVVGLTLASSRCCSYCCCWSLLLLLFCHYHYHYHYHHHHHHFELSFIPYHLFICLFRTWFIIPLTLTTICFFVKNGYVLLIVFIYFVVADIV